MLFDGNGCLMRTFRGQGVWGTENDDSWIIVFDRIVVKEPYRRRGAVIQGERCNNYAY